MEEAMKLTNIPIVYESGLYVVDVLESYFGHPFDVEFQVDIQFTYERVPSILLDGEDDEVLVDLKVSVYCTDSLIDSTNAYAMERQFKSHIEYFYNNSNPLPF